MDMVYLSSNLEGFLGILLPNALDTVITTPVDRDR